MLKSIFCLWPGPSAKFPGIMAHIYNWLSDLSFTWRVPLGQNVRRELFHNQLHNMIWSMHDLCFGFYMIVINGWLLQKITLWFWYVLC